MGRGLRTARNTIREVTLAYCIRQSQEAVELSLKAALRLAGIKPPKCRDVGPILVEKASAYPEWFRKLIPSLTATSRWLRREREPSMYGDEELGLPPSKLYTEPYAKRALEEAETAYKSVAKLLEEARSRVSGREKFKQKRTG